MNVRMRPAWLPCAAILALVVMHACGDGGTEPRPPDPPRPTTVTVSPATAQLTGFGATVQLSAEVRDQNGNVMAGATVSWSSSAAAVATVDAAGLVTAADNGAATITAMSGDASGTSGWRDAGVARRGRRHAVADRYIQRRPRCQLHLGRHG